MPVAKPNPAAKTAKAATVPARTARPAPRKTAKPAAPVKAAVKAAAAKAPARKTPAAKTPRPAPAAPAAEAKPPKIKLVRDSFTIPKPEYAVLDELKQRAAKLAQPAKKSELLRAGVKALAAMSNDDFLAALKAVPAIKTGRPKS